MLGQEATYYDLLGIESDASGDAIKEAYRNALARIRSYLGTDGPPWLDKLNALRAAYQTLSDPATRQAYDDQLVAAKTPLADQPVPPATTAVAANPPVAVPGEWAFRFSGDGGEYFRIWIVNLLLSILTLGIYSAWAKVRREQYFHRHLWLDDSAFDYHGQPLAILKGRAIALVLVVLLSLAQKAGPLAYGVALLCLLPLVPWLAIRALSFRAYNTSYRGLRFSFHGSYGEAFRVFVLYGLFAMFTLWLAFPFWYRRLRTFIFNNLRFGNAEFQCNLAVGQVYGAVLGPVLLGLLAMFGLGALLAMIGSGVSRQGMAVGAMIVFPLLIIGFQVAIIPWIGARLLNVVWNSVEVAQNRFSSTLQIGRYILLTATNWLAIVCTLGLFFPWAQVRMARYRAESLCIMAAGDLDSFVAGELSSASALGDQAAEMFDLDIGL